MIWRVADLQRKRRFGIGCVPDGLAVTADRGHAFDRNLRGFEQSRGGLRELDTELPVQIAGRALARFRFVGDRVGEGRENRIGPGLLMRAEQPAVAFVEFDERGIDAVHTGARHEPDVELGHQWGHPGIRIKVYRRRRVCVRCRAVAAAGRPLAGSRPDRPRRLDPRRAV